MKKLIQPISLILLGVALAAGSMYTKNYYEDSQISNFDECSKAGFPVQESYPAVCVVQGRSYTQIIPENNKPKPFPQNTNITVTSPLPNSQVTSPLTITGQAKGSWYFEASFPVKLYDANNILIAQGTAQAQGNWQTTNFVPFTVTLTFATPSTTTGYLVLEKDNPSGEPQNADSISIPVTF